MKENPLKKLLTEPLTAENYTTSYKQFGDRQAGVGLVYSPEEDRYYYNAYCIEMKLLKELVSVEFEFLDDALEMINADFGPWKLEDYDKKKSGCGSCAAKR